MSKEKHELDATYTNAYGQVTHVCTCGAAVDDHDAHVIDVARAAKIKAEREAALKAARATLA